jgi:hypothetical protein
METVLSTVSTELAKTQPAPPTATATPSRPPATQVPRSGPDFEPEIVDITFRSGHAEVRFLQGEYSIGEPSSSRDVYGRFLDSRMLSLLTVFANPAVQNAAIWLNDDTIGNLASSDSIKPANYVFRRAEIETYLILITQSDEYRSKTFPDLNDRASRRRRFLF